MISLADELKSLGPAVEPSPWPGYEWVEGFGVMAMPFTSGHLLVLRAFPRNAFAPYTSVWHRTPAGAWTIFVDGAPLEQACPRYFGAAANASCSAHVEVTWTGPMDLQVKADPPGLRWAMSFTEPAYLRGLNVVSSRLPEAAWRSSLVLRGMEQMAATVLGMGAVQLSGKVPSGHWATMTPRRMSFVSGAHAAIAVSTSVHRSRQRHRQPSARRTCQADQHLRWARPSSSRAGTSEWLPSPHPPSWNTSQWA